MNTAVRSYNPVLEAISMERKNEAMKKHSAADIDRAVRSAKASLQVEGITVTEQEEALVMARIKGEMTQSDFLRRAKEAALNVR